MKDQKREIKFRVWDKVAKQMSPEFVLFGEFLLVGAIHAWQHEFRKEPDSLEMLNDLEVMQFTGLHDKNGKEIYEGDICWTYEHGIGNLNRTVVFKDGSFCLQHPNMLTVELRGWKPDYIEIIGNVYSNPEMITK